MLNFFGFSFVRGFHKHKWMYKCALMPEDAERGFIYNEGCEQCFERRCSKCFKREIVRKFGWRSP